MAERSVTIKLNHVKPADYRPTSSREHAYRKGVAHGLWLALDMLSCDNWDITDLYAAACLSLEWRFDSQPHSALCDELIKKVEDIRNSGRRQR